MSKSFIRGVWGDINLSGIRGGKIRKDIDAIKANPYCSITDFVVYVFGKENYDLLKSEGFVCKLISEESVVYDMKERLYRHKLDILKSAMEDFDEIVFLDWDCVPIKPLPHDFWGKLNNKAPFQANLFQYRTKKCLWRNADWRKVCNGGFLYLRDKKIADDFIDNYNNLSLLVDNIMATRKITFDDLRFREKALIFDDEPSFSKWIDDYSDGWKGEEHYWDNFEPDFCNLKKKSVYQDYKLESKPCCFMHWGN